MIIHILQAKLKDINRKTVESEGRNSLQDKVQNMVNALCKVLNPDKCQPLNSTIVITDSSSAEELGKDNNPFDAKICATISRSKSGKKQVAEEKVEQLSQTIKLKDEIIENLYLSVGKLNSEISKLTATLSDKEVIIKSLEGLLEENENAFKKTLEELQQLKESTENNQREMLQNEKNLKHLLDASNETNLKLKAALKKAEEELLSENILKEKLTLNEEMISDLKQKLDDSENNEAFKKLKIEMSDMLRENKNLNKANQTLTEKKKEAEEDRALLMRNLEVSDMERQRQRNELFEKDVNYNLFWSNVQENTKLKE